MGLIPSPIVVCLLVTVLANDPDIISFTLNTMYGFLRGIIPELTNLLKPIKIIFNKNSLLYPLIGLDRYYGCLVSFNICTPNSTFPQLLLTESFTSIHFGKGVIVLVFSSFYVAFCIL